MTTRGTFVVRVAAAMTIAVVFSSCVVAQQRRPAPGFGMQALRIQSPEVAADRQITFRVFAPQAEGVRLSGSDIPDVGQGLDMQKADEGLWEVNIGPVAPGAYRYRFDVDGVAVIDPRNPDTSQSNSNSDVASVGIPRSSKVSVPSRVSMLLSAAWDCVVNARQSATAQSVQKVLRISLLRTYLSFWTLGSTQRVAARDSVPGRARAAPFPRVLQALSIQIPKCG